MNRRLLCVFLLISASGCGAADRRRFDELERASRAIQAAMDGKADRLQYRQLLARYATELSSVAPLVKSSRGEKALAEYQAAFKGLTDLDLVWEEKDTRGLEMLPIREALPARIAREYELGVNTNEPPSIYAGEALATIRETARRHLRAASVALGSGP